MYSKPSPGASGLSKPTSQPRRKNAGKFAIGGSPTKLKGYQASSFSGRPFSARAATPPHKKG